MRLTVAALAVGASGHGRASDYPAVPEPMIFDMMRPLGARRGELEANILATAPLSGPDRPLSWAPEVEYALADGFAIEGELPFENGRPVEYKLGLQAAFGSFDGGRSAHGVQYLGIYGRHERRYSSSLAYMVVHRFSDRWSSVSMAGLWDIGTKRRTGRNAAIVNQSLFYDASDASVIGLEINYLGGQEGHMLIMPQLHLTMTEAMGVQAGLGFHKDRGKKGRPHAGLRVIRQF
jgi:hypothetical protein